MSEFIDPTVNADNGEVAAPEMSQEMDDIEIQEETTEEEHPEQGLGEKDSADAEQKPVQDAETNAKFAEMRREIEVLKKQTKQQDEWVKNNFGDIGLKTWEEYQNYVERERDRQYLEQQGYDPDVIEELINKKVTEKVESHPTVAAAKQREIEAYQEGQLKKLNEKYSLDLSSIEDIQKLPNADEMIDKIVKGYEWHEAYLITHQDHITQKQLEKTKQATLNNQKSKEHLKTKTGSADVEAFAMPEDVMAHYRRMFAKEIRSGKMTEKDFVAHYRKSIGK